MPYAIMRFQKCAAGGVAAKNRHNERLKSEYKSNPNIDRDRTKNNYHLVEPHGKYKQCYTEMIERAGCRTRSNSTVLVETLLTASPEFMNQLKPQEQRQFFERAAAFLYERIGKENVVSAIVHMDEKTPHMHFCFVPITKDGRLSAKEVLGNKAAMCKYEEQEKAQKHLREVERYCERVGLTMYQYEKQCFMADRGFCDYPYPEQHNPERQQEHDIEKEPDRSP